MHASLAAETHPADEELVQVAVIREEFLKLCGRPRIPVTSKRQSNILNPTKQMIIIIIVIIINYIRQPYLYY